MRYLTNKPKRRREKMERTNVMKLAETILQLDQLRDELYEELMVILGPKAHEFLRKVQNR